MTSAIFFDLGNTLVSYYRRDQFPEILDKAVRNVIGELKAQGISIVPHDTAYSIALSEDRESGDFRVNPMINPSSRIRGVERR